MLKKILLFLLIALIVIQFIQPSRNKAEGEQAGYIGNALPIPENVKMILAKACNDCHTNNTNYPWYSRIQPVHWWLNNHIREGKQELNLDEYTTRNLRYQYHKLEEIAEQVRDGEMPLNSYTWVHKNAKLTAEEKNALINWADAMRDSMMQKYPTDSLVRKK